MPTSQLLDGAFHSIVDKGSQIKSFDLKFRLEKVPLGFSAWTVILGTEIASQIYFRAGVECYFDALAIALSWFQEEVISLVPWNGNFGTCICPDGIFPNSS